MDELTSKFENIVKSAMPWRKRLVINHLLWIMFSPTNSTPKEGSPIQIEGI